MLNPFQRDKYVEIDQQSSASSLKYWPILLFHFVLQHWAFFQRELGVFLWIIVDLMRNTVNLIVNVALFCYLTKVILQLFSVLWFEKWQMFTNQLKLLPKINNLQKYYHPVSFICAWAMPQSRKGLQKVHYLEKTTVLCHLSLLSSPFLLPQAAVGGMLCWGRVCGALLVVVLAVPAHLAQEPSYRYVFYDGDEAEYDSLQV